MKKCILFFCAVVCSIYASAQQSLVFTPAGATGQFGPTQAQVTTAYASTPLAGKVFIKNGIQKWVVPQTGYYRIQTMGAQGYGPFGGRGASITGEFILTGGDTLKILVGQKGAPPVGLGTNQYGGGGGSFVTTRTNTPLIISGGGGGSWATTYTVISDAPVTTSGNTGGGTGSTFGVGGTAGQGGASATNGDGGGGLLGNGLGTTGGLSFVNGGAGGRSATNGGEGGFGGGGGGASYNDRRSGGGGGYSGGGGAHGVTTGFPEAGGGGSFNSGTNAVALAGARLGDGQVVITPLSSGQANDLAVIAVDAPKNFCAGVRNVVATIQNFGTNNITSATINWRINGVLQTPYSYTGTLNTIGGTGSISAQVTLGSYNFLAATPYTIKVWGSSPNGTADPVASNDTITVIRSSGLLAPTGLAVGTTTGTTASVSWNTLGGAGYVIEYGPAGFTLGTGIRKTGTGTSYMITGLNPTTNYDVYLADSCGLNDIGAFAGPVPFATGCLTTASGNYTINKNAAPSATNFVSFSQLAFALNSCGVSGPVTVNVTPGSGPYYEKVEFGSIFGVSSTNTVIINGNGESIIDSGKVTTAYAAVLLNGTDYLTMDSIRVRAIGLTNRHGIQFMGAADHNIVRRCVIEMDAAATASTVGAIVFSESKTSISIYGNTGNHNLIEGNTTKGGYYAVRHHGTSTTVRCLNNEFIDNKFLDYYTYGIYNYYEEGTKMRNNEFARPNRGVISTFYGIYGYYTSDNVEVTGNWIHDGFAQATGSTSAMYAIYFSTSNNSAGSKGLIANNLIVDNNNAGTHYPFYNIGSANWLYYHNTIVENDPASGAGATRMFYQTTAATGIEVKNNLFYLNRIGTGAHFMNYLGTSTSVIDFNNNAYYMPGAGSGTSNFGYYSANVPTFAAWQAANGGVYDALSLVNDPLFANLAAGDYTPTAAYFNNIGANVLSVVPTDFLGVARTTSPDPGAFEFSPPPGPDLSISSITQLSGATCGTSTDLSVDIINIGTDTVLSTIINYTVNGVAQTPIPLSAVFATGLTINTTLLNIPISGTGATTVVVTLSGSLPGTDIDPANNTKSISVRPGYSGVLTVNSAGTPSDVLFNSFSALGAALSNYGVCGPVTVNVVANSGPYAEQFVLNDIPGVSSVNTVTINGNGETLQFAASNSAERATIIFNGADWVTIDSLSVAATGTYGFGISFTGNADHNTISNSTITVDIASTSTNFAGITISGSLSSGTTAGASGNYNTIEGNTIKGGYYGIICYGGTADSLDGNRFINNQVTDFYYMGIYNYYTRYAMINGNDISRPTRTSNTTFYGIYAYANNNAKIIGNKIHDPFPGNLITTSAAYGIYAYRLIGSPGDSAIMANNLLYNFNSNGTQYIFAPYITSYAKVVHNTVVADDPNSTATPTRYVIYNPSTVDNSHIQNNIVWLNRNVGGTTYMYYQAGTVDANSVIDNNAYFAPSGYTGYSFGYFNGAAISSFPAWQSTTGFDQNSVFTNPFFVNMAGNNFTPQSKVLDGFGVNFTAQVPKDINNVTRTVPVDAGAIEFTGAPCTGLSGVQTQNITATSATINWNADPAGVKIEWGPTGFKQASIAGTIVNVPVGTSTSVLSGLNGNSCYDYYLTINCTSSIPGAPPVMGPFTFCTPCLGGGLNAGTYTVGGAPGPGNFATIDSVIDVLMGCGIKGSVVFNVQPGQHVVSKIIGPIDGTSASSTITFDGSATLRDSVSSSAAAVFDLNGAKHFILKGLTLINQSGRGVWLHNNADSNTVENCMIYLNPTGTTAAMAGIIASNSATGLTAGADVDRLIARGNTVDGGYYGIVSYGNGTTSKVNNVVIENNIMQNQYYYGIYAYYNQNLNIKGNRVKGLRNTASYGMYLVYPDNFFIEKNEVLDAKTYGVYLSSANTGLTSNPAVRSTFINNMVSVTTSAVYFTTVSYLNVYHNNLEGTYGYRQFTPTSLDIRNNIFVASSNYAFESGTAVASPSVVNNNIYHKRAGTAYLKDGTPTFNTLAAWKTAAPLLNTTSLEGAPLFKSTTDLHVLGTLANDVGDNSVGVTTDFDGQSRPASGSTIVDIGADEFTPLNFDVAITSLNSIPGSGACGDSLTQVELTILNQGLSALSGIPITATVSGSGTGSFSSTFTGPLSALGTATITFGPVNTAAGGTYNVKVYTGLSSDQDRSNDTLTASFTFKSVLAPVITAQLDTFCAGSYDTLYAPTGTSDKYEWRDVNGVVLGTASKLTVGPLLAADTTFRLASVSQSFSLGPKNLSIGASVNFVDASVQQLYFTAIQSFTLDSVTVFPNGNGNVNINLVDFTTNAILQTVTVAVTGVTVAGSAKRIAVGMTIPAGVYKMHGGGSTTGGLWRNSTGGNYPYTVPGVVSITGNSFDPVSYYYYYYDWKISSGGCPKPTATITLYNGAGSLSAAFTNTLQGSTPTTMSFDFNASTSMGATTYAWDFGDGSTGSGMVANHTYTTNGTYQVTLTITGPCGTQMVTQTVNVNIGLEENAMSRSLRVYPNPSSKLINVSFVTEGSENGVLRIVDMAGRELKRITRDNLNGSFNETIDLGALPDGVYLLEINSGDLSARRRLIKN